MNELHIDCYIKSKCFNPRSRKEGGVEQNTPHDFFLKKKKKKKKKKKNNKQK